MVPLTATVPKIYVSTMTTIISNYYDSLVETLTHTKSIKLKDHPGENVVDFCDVTLVDDECLAGIGAVNPKHFDYIISIFVENSYS